MRWETEYFDERHGRKLVANLKVPRLREGVVPSKLPNCPEYLSGSSSRRESPGRKRIRHEESAILTAVAQRKSLKGLVTKIELAASITAIIVMYNYIVINKLLELPVFCNATSQRA